VIMRNLINRNLTARFFKGYMLFLLLLAQYPLFLAIGMKSNRSIKINTNTILPRQIL